MTVGILDTLIAADQAAQSAARATRAQQDAREGAAKLQAVAFAAFGRGDAAPLASLLVTVEELHSVGCHKEAEDLAAWVKSTLGAIPELAAGVAEVDERLDAKIPKARRQAGKIAVG